ncbi:MAG: hypothetical protein R3E96_00725 [Planctomycetota bacterium]
MWHLNFLARTLLVLLVLCGSAWPAQNPRWWQGEQEARFNDCLDRLDRDRLGPDYIPQLLERVESASITPQGESSDSAEAYLELLFLKINPTPALKANQDRNRNGEPSHLAERLGYDSFDTSLDRWLGCRRRPLAAALRLS